MDVKRKPNSRVRVLRSYAMWFSFHQMYRLRQRAFILACIKHRQRLIRWHILPWQVISVDIRHVDSNHQGFESCLDINIARSRGAPSEQSVAASPAPAYLTPASNATTLTALRIEDAALIYRFTSEKVQQCDLFPISTAPRSPRRA